MNNSNKPLSDYAGDITGDLQLIQDLLAVGPLDDETRRKISAALAQAGAQTQMILQVLKQKLEGTAV